MSSAQRHNAGSSDSDGLAYRFKLGRTDTGLEAEVLHSAWTVFSHVYNVAGFLYLTYQQILCACPCSPAHLESRGLPVGVWDPTQDCRNWSEGTEPGCPSVANPGSGSPLRMPTITSWHRHLSSALQSWGSIAVDTDAVFCHGTNSSSNHIGL